ALKLQNILNELGAQTDIIDLQKLDLPLYTPEVQAKGPQPKAKALNEAFKEANAMVICSPEYNGSMPPVLVNAISWISVSGEKDWRHAFNQKFIAIASHNAGGGVKLGVSLQQLLQHLG